MTIIAVPHRKTRLSELNGKLVVTKRLSYGVGFVSSKASFEKE
jgi:hypothetical protein